MSSREVVILEVVLEIIFQHCYNNNYSVADKTLENSPGVTMIQGEVHVESVYFHAGTFPFYLPT